MRWQEDLNKILALAEPIKQVDVTNAVDGNVQRGYLLIKQLIRENKLVKDGRGEEAVYKLTDTGKAGLAKMNEENAEQNAEQEGGDEPPHPVEELA